MRFKDFLRIGRAQTYPASLLLIMTGFLVGGGNLFSFFALFLIIFAWLSHISAFGDNSLMDALTGEDMRDIHKQHHPLVKGIVKLKEATNIIQTGMFLTVIFGVILIVEAPGNRLLASLCFIVYIAAGHYYNNHFSKTSVFRGIPISICFTFLFLWAYFLSAKEFTPLILLCGGYIFLLEYFENDVEGSIKEIDAKEANLLRVLGVKVKGNIIHFSLGSKIWGWGLKLGSIFMMVCVFTQLHSQHNIFTMLLFWLFVIIMVYFCEEILKSGEWDRNKALKNFSIEEITSIYLIPIVLMPLVGYTDATLLMIAGVVYFLLMNRYLWGVFYPRV